MRRGHCDDALALTLRASVAVRPLAVAALRIAGIVAYEPRRADPLLEVRLFRSVPFTAAIAMALFALSRSGCRFSSCRGSAGGSSEIAVRYSRC